MLLHVDGALLQDSIAVCAYQWHMTWALSAKKKVEVVAQEK